MNEPQPSQHKSMGTLIAAIVLIVLLAGLLIFSTTGLSLWQNADESSQVGNRPDEGEQPNESTDQGTDDDTPSIDAISGLTRTIVITANLDMIPLDVTPEITPTLSIQLAKIEDPYDLGNQSTTDGNYELAIEQFSQALEKSRTEPIWSHLGRAYAYERLGRTEEALADYTEAIVYEPENAKVYQIEAGSITNKGIIYRHLLISHWRFNLSMILSPGPTIIVG